MIDFQYTTEFCTRNYFNVYASFMMNDLDLDRTVFSYKSKPTNVCKWLLSIYNRCGLNRVCSSMIDLDCEKHGFETRAVLEVFNLLNLIPF